MVSLRSGATKTLGRYTWGSLCALLAAVTLAVFILGLYKGVLSSWRDVGITIAFFGLFAVAVVHSFFGIPLISKLSAKSLRSAANIAFALALAPLVIPIIQFVKFLQEGVWYQINVVNSLGYVVLKMLETGWGDANLTPRLFSWCVEPASWLGLHTFLSWIPLTLVLFAVTLVLFGGAGVLLIEEAKDRETGHPA